MSLQNSLNLLRTYCDTWALQANIKNKTNNMVFRSKRPLLDNEIWYHDNVQVDVVID